ncbi:hypothetical protein E6W39_03575 [Kitasatospora acidiphila]|uniref:Gram-positive cocci surface proteins LPxTG domain-containing protein n=1 Tax=Kitasatospora acidiphila TaxID=2567942 RepID=A0A540VXK8_9ACTN|nr:hypothetical protein [Kitasatospora acidiphila]TQF01492.1 hypothetical protein E6W39_03575 [Kitasatospora acidiphila]
MRNNIRTGRRAGRLVALALGAAALMAVVSPAAQADQGQDVPDLAGAQQVLASDHVHSTVSQFLGAMAAGSPSGAPTMPRAAESPVAGQAFSMDAPVPLYELSPDFVRGTSSVTPGNTVHLAFLATPVTSKDGHHADVLLSHRTGSWALAGVRSESEDTGYAKRATPGTTIFTEPQIHAWYELADDKVQPLNHEAQDGLAGRPSLSLAEYQKLVHQRYADELPGSAYDQKGLAGGYGLASAQKAQQSGPSTAELGASGAAALALAGGTLTLRRRRARRQE